MVNIPDKLKSGLFDVGKTDKNTEYQKTHGPTLEPHPDDQNVHPAAQSTLNKENPDHRKDNKGPWLEDAAITGGAAERQEIEDEHKAEEKEHKKEEKHHH